MALPPRQLVFGGNWSCPPLLSPLVSPLFRLGQARTRPHVLEALGFRLLGSPPPSCPAAHMYMWGVATWQVDEGVLSCVFAYMKKAGEDRLDGMVCIFQVWC